ncbi:hypothetical protein MMC19_004843 [Ptychographa xylographoides]|nr:hypothetical protein [Ptychographa xylographoides]
MNEFEAHESSYDHQHKKRLKEMKQMQRDPLASSKARKAERKADEKSGLITIKPVKLDMGSAAVAGSGFKKGGFKNAFGGDAEVKKEYDGESGSGNILAGLVRDREGEPIEQELAESDTDNEYECYDPRRPTGCFEGCEGRR